MKDRGPADTTSGPIFGRELIILLVVVFSGLSFTLGFFVGRSSAPKPGGYIQTSENVQRQKQEVKASQAIQEPQQTTEQLPTSQTAPASSVQTEQEAPPRTEPQNQQQKNSSKPNAAETGSKQVKESHVRSAGKSDDTPRDSEKTTLYTVQLGAFKNPADAKNIKARLEKKGYKVSISAQKNSTGQKVYKVRAGEYKDKKEAEVLALKLRKTENLHTFVTTKADQETPRIPLR